MKNNETGKTAETSNEQLLHELLEGINKQLELNLRLKEILEPLMHVSSKKKSLDITGEIAEQVKDLFIQSESLQAEERAVFHQMFGSDEG